MARSREIYRDICDHPEAETLEETARYVLRQLGAFLQLRVDTADELPAETPETEFPRWFRRFDETMRRFASAGIRTQADVQAGRRQYVKNRLEWERQLGAFAAFAVTTGRKSPVTVTSSKPKITPVNPNPE